MNINRNNYEEYFLLYTDNELSAADKKAVEDFIRQNPDLQSEFNMLQQSTFSADDRIVFRNKEVLMHEPVNDGLIHHGNFQEMFILYADEELTADEKTAVEKFVYHHPQYQEEFELVQSVKLIPDMSVTFPGKNRLYHQPGQGAKRMVFTWGRVAVAAAVLVFAGVIWLAKPGTDVSSGIAKSDIKPALKIRTEAPGPGIRVTAPADPAKIKLPVPEDASEKQVIAGNRENARPGKNAATGHIAKTSMLVKLKKDKTVAPGSGNPALAINPSKAGIGAYDENNQTVQPEIVNENIAARAANPKVSEPGTPAKQEIIHSLVQKEAAHETSDIILASNDNEDVLNIAGIPVDRKGSIRGLFRKASRFIDKNTSIRTAKKQGLVIGNIEIAFQ